MKIIMLKRLLTALLLSASLLGQNGAAQTQRQEVKAAWNIYVERQDGMNFPFAVYRKEEHIGGTALENLPRLVGWETPLDKLPVAGLHLMAYLENGVVQVQVWVVYRDVDMKNDRPKYGNKEELLTEFLLPFDEALVVKDLAKVGLVPITLKLIPAKPKPEYVVPIVFPQVISKVAGLEVLSVEKLSAERDAPENRFSTRYEVEVVNVSDKTVVYLETERETPLSYCCNYGSRRGTLRIAPGATYKMRVAVVHPSRGAAAATEEALNQPITFAIITAIFDDGTYIGDQKRVGRQVTYWRGYEIQNIWMIPLLKHLLESTGQDLNGAISSFLKESEQVRIDPAPEEIEKLAAQFPLFPRQDIKRELQLALETCKLIREEIKIWQKLLTEDQKNYKPKDFLRWLRNELNGRNPNI